MIENIWQRHENKARSAVGIDTIGKTGRKDDQAGNNRNKSIQNGYIHGFAQKRPFFPDVASEDCHGADAQAERKESLGHCAAQHIADAKLRHPAEIRQKIEEEPFGSAFQGNAVDCENDHNGKQSQHHEFGDLFQTVLQSYGTDPESKQYDDGHKTDHPIGIGQHVFKNFPDGLHIRAGKGAVGHIKEVMKHPSRNRGVKHHQQIIAGHRRISVQMPFLPRFLQRLI